MTARRSDERTTKMISKSQRSRIVPLLGAIALAAVLSACSSGTGAAPASPVPAPATPAHAAPTPVTPAPTSLPAPTTLVDLVSTSGQDVTIDIVDRTGAITGAKSGTPAEGVSFPTDAVVIENIGPRTLRLGWSDFPVDNELRLFVDPVGVGYRLLVIQPAPTGPVDAMGEDRILELTFDRDVSAAEVEAFIQEGLDTPG